MLKYYLGQSSTTQVPNVLSKSHSSADANTLQDEEYFYNTKGEFVAYEILRVICNDFPGVAAVLGDQLESASPADISFWPIHPTLER
jgi:hypothetical protein